MAENFLVTLRVEFDVVQNRQKLTLWQPGTGMQHEDENRDVLLFLSLNSGISSPYILGRQSECSSGNCRVRTNRNVPYTGTFSFGSQCFDQGCGQVEVAAEVLRKLSTILEEVVHHRAAEGIVVEPVRERATTLPSRDHGRDLDLGRARTGCTCKLFGMVGMILKLFEIRVRTVFS